MIVDFKTVSTEGVESSPVAVALSGLRANEARYIWNKFNTPFQTYPVGEKRELMSEIEDLLKRERNLVFCAKPLEIAQLFLEENILWTWVFYEDGLAINIVYDCSDPKRRAVGLKLSEGMEVPEALVNKFKFARQKSKLAGMIRGSYFILKGENEQLMKKWIDGLESK